MKTKITRNKPDAESLEWYRESVSEKRSSRLRGAILFVLCLIIVLGTIAYGAVDAWAWAGLAVFAGLTVILWLADSFITREFRLSGSPMQIALLGLIIIGLVQLLPLRASLAPDLLSIPASGALSLDPYATRFFVVQLCIYLIFFAAALTFIETEKRMRAIVFTVVIFGAVMAFLGVILSLTSDNPNSILGMRENSDAFPFATFVNRHHFAAFMNMTIGLTLGLLYGKATARDKKLLLIVAVVLMGIAMIFTGSRGGIISLFGVVGFVVLVNLFQRSDDEELTDGDEKLSDFRRKLLLVGSAAALILVLFGSVLMLGGDKWLGRGIGLDSQADVSNGRLHFWRTTWQIIIHHPILGAGLDAFGAAYPNYDTANGNFRVEQAHNEYLQMPAEAGIFGFACLAWFIYFLFKRGLRAVVQSENAFRRGVAVGALAGCVGIIIHSFFDFPLRTSSNAFVFLMLAALATVSIKDDESVRKRRRRATKTRVKDSEE